jgi:hypothetical protein
MLVVVIEAMAVDSGCILGVCHVLLGWQIAHNYAISVRIYSMCLRRQVLGTMEMRQV